MIANAATGDYLSVKLSNGSTKIIKLKEIKTYGVEGYLTTITSSPLTFFPFHNIISVTKYEQQS
jgi:hypothetical protein